MNLPVAPLYKGQKIFSMYFVQYPHQASVATNFPENFLENFPPHITSDSVTSEWWRTDEDKHLCLKWDSNPRSQCPCDQGLCLWPRDHWDQRHCVKAAV